MDQLPFSKIHDLSDLSDAGAEVPVKADPEQRAKIAKWAGIDGVEAFAAEVTLKRRGANRFAYDAVLGADITQSCVVSLAPVRTSMRLSIQRELHLTRFPAQLRISEQDIAPAGDDGPEEIQDSRYDLAAPLLEEFSLALDPYPRAPGVAFEPEANSEGAPENPFAVLKSLKGTP